MMLTHRSISSLLLLFFFFFQAEDGIRDYKVTGVQTCALPICPSPAFLQFPQGLFVGRFLGLGHMHHGLAGTAQRHADRKSTRLNSSHLVISYAVFCLKKKKRRTEPSRDSATPDSSLSRAACVS